MASTSFCFSTMLNYTPDTELLEGVEEDDDLSDMLAQEYDYVDEFDDDGSTFCYYGYETLAEYGDLSDIIAQECEYVEEIDEHELPYSDEDDDGKLGNMLERECDYVEQINEDSSPFLDEDKDGDLYVEEIGGNETPFTNETIAQELGPKTNHLVDANVVSARVQECLKIISDYDVEVLEGLKKIRKTLQESKKMKDESFEKFKRTRAFYELNYFDRGKVLTFKDDANSLKFQDSRQRARGRQYLFMKAEILQKSMSKDTLRLLELYLSKYIHRLKRRQRPHQRRVKPLDQPEVLVRPRVYRRLLRRKKMHRHVRYEIAQLEPNLLNCKFL